MHRQASPIFSDLPLFAQPGVASVVNDEDTYGLAVRVPDYDICEQRSGNQGGSDAANDVAAPTKQQMRDAVYHAVVRTGADGLTLRELALRWDLPMHTLSGRFSELKDQGLVVRLQDAAGKCILRDGCGVWIART
jgi:hypothetical protein